MFLCVWRHFRCLNIQPVLHRYNEILKNIKGIEGKTEPGPGDRSTCFHYNLSVRSVLVFFATLQVKRIDIYCFKTEADVPVPYHHLSARSTSVGTSADTEDEQIVRADKRSRGEKTDAELHHLSTQAQRSHVFNSTLVESSVSSCRDTPSISCVLPRRSYLTSEATKRRMKNRSNKI